MVGGRVKQTRLSVKFIFLFVSAHGPCDMEGLLFVTVEPLSKQF